MTDSSASETEREEEIQNAVAYLSDAHELVTCGDDDEAMMAIEQCMETLRDVIADYDVQQPNSPMWEIGEGDVDSYVGNELVDVSFTALGTAVVLVFETEDGDHHGFKLTPRESVRVCNVEGVS